jgi:hypothetical protein
VPVRSTLATYTHYVNGGRDALGMGWTYQRTLCGREAPNLGWKTPEWYIHAGHEALPECPKCLHVMNLRTLSPAPSLPSPRERGA